MFNILVGEEPMEHAKQIVFSTAYLFFVLGFLYLAVG